MNIDKNVLVIIIIAIISLSSLCLISRKMTAGFGPFNLKVYGLTLVISVSALVVLSDIPSEKLVACFGILGSFAGYLFGLKKDE